MPSRSRLAAFTASLLPAAIDVSVTDYCNADCDFCGFAKSKMKGKPRHFIDTNEFVRALPILVERGISFVDFQGGEPLLHPEIIRMVSAVRDHGMKSNLITNGWSLPTHARDLAGAGLKALFISIDSHDMVLHEKNRGLKGVEERIKDGIALMSSYGIPVMASVTVSRLADIRRLPDTLGSLGFSGVTFSYPRREAFESSSLVFNENSELIDFTDAELVAVLDQILEMKKEFPVLNPTASVFDFAKFPDDRTRCTACTMSCYRDSSTMMFAPLAASAALDKLAHAEPVQAVKTLFDPRVMESAKSAMQEAGLLLRMCKGYARN